MVPRKKLGVVGDFLNSSSELVKLRRIPPATLPP